MSLQSELHSIDRQILDAERRVADQKERVIGLEREGRSTDTARELLRILESSLGLLNSRRNLLMRQLE